MKRLAFPFPEEEGAIGEILGWWDADGDGRWDIGTVEVEFIDLSERIATPTDTIDALVSCCTESYLPPTNRALEPGSSTPTGYKLK